MFIRVCCLVKTETLATGICHSEEAGIRFIGVCRLVKTETLSAGICRLAEAGRCLSGFAVWLKQRHCLPAFARSAEAGIRFIGVCRLVKTETLPAGICRSAESGTLFGGISYDRTVFFSRAKLISAVFPLSFPFPRARTFSPHRKKLQAGLTLLQQRENVHFDAAIPSFSESGDVGTFSIR